MGGTTTGNLKKANGEESTIEREKQPSERHVNLGQVVSMAWGS